MPQPKVFCDANIFFAATKSPAGGSALILRLAKERRIKIITVKQTLFEAEKNISEKLGQKYLERYYQLILDASPEIQVITKATLREIAFLGKNLSSVKYFGLANQKFYLDTRPHAMDALYCPHCGQHLLFEGIYLGHLGNWKCSNC